MTDMETGERPRGESMFRTTLSREIVPSEQVPHILLLCFFLSLSLVHSVSWCSSLALLSGFCLHWYLCFSSRPPPKTHHYIRWLSKVSHKASRTAAALQVKERWPQSPLKPQTRDSSLSAEAVHRLYCA